MADGRGPGSVTLEILSCSQLLPLGCTCSLYFLATRSEKLSPPHSFHPDVFSPYRVRNSGAKCPCTETVSQNKLSSFKWIFLRYYVTAVEN